MPYVLRASGKRLDHPRRIASDRRAARTPPRSDDRQVGLSRSEGDQESGGPSGIPVTESLPSPTRRDLSNEFGYPRNSSPAMRSLLVPSRSLRPRFPAQVPSLSAVDPPDPGVI